MTQTKISNRGVRPFGSAHINRKLVCFVFVFMLLSCLPSAAQSQSAVWIGTERAPPGLTTQFNSGLWHDTRNWGDLDGQMTVPDPTTDVYFNFQDMGTNSADLGRLSKATLTINGSANAKSIRFETRDSTRLRPWGDWSNTRGIDVTLGGYTPGANLDVAGEIKLVPSKGNNDIVARLKDLT